MKPLLLTLNNIGPFCGQHTLDFSELGEMYLICGKMGSGKTTIFDALTYALYGKVPGSRSSIGAKALFSDFASPEDLCQIDFLFEIKGEKYRIIRNPPKNQDKKTKGEGKLLFYEVKKSGEEILLGKNKSDVDKIIVEKIGLTDDEFSRIVLLPQGEFAAFLKQKSSDKQKTLAKLFPSEYYSKIVERVKAINDEMATEKKILQGQLLNITEDFNPQTYEENIKREKDFLLKYKNHLENSEKKLTDLEKNLIEKTQEFDKIQKTLSNKEELSNLLLNEKEVKKNQELVKKAEKTEVILPLLNSKNQSENQFNQLILELEKTETLLVFANEKYKKAEKEGQQIKTLSKKLEKEKITEEKLKSADDKFKLLKLSKEKIKKLFVEEELIENEKTILQENILEIEKKISFLKEKTENYFYLMEEKNNSKDSFEKFVELQNLYFEKEKYSDICNVIKGEILEAQNLAQSNKELLEEYKNQLEERKSKNLAFILGAKLQENDPCPVCGSLHHPNVVKSQVDFKSLEEKILIQEKNLESQKNILEIKINQQTQNTALLDSTSKKIKEKISLAIDVFSKNKSLLDNNLNIDFSTMKSLEKLISKKDNLKIFESTEKIIENQLNEINNFIEEKEVLEKNLVEVKNQLEKRLEKLPEIKTSLEVEKTKISNIEEELSKINLENKVEFNLVKEDFFTKEHSLCKQRILDLEEKIKVLEENLEDTKSTYEKLISSKEVLEKQKETRNKEKTLALNKFLEALNESDFKTEEEILASVMERGNLAEVKKSVEEYYLKINGLKTLLSEEKDYSVRDLENCKKAKEELGENIKSLNLEKDEFKNKVEFQSIKVATLEKAKSNYDKNIEKQQEILEKAEVYEKLNKALSGDNPKKTPFDAWYLGIFLSEITYYASLRLRKMTENRYSMRLGGAANNRGLKGLDLEILDSHTKKTRSVDSLSGGETFLASLSLALALTDTVQSKKGGIQLDSLFIDEGFGSLDETALESALATLDEVRENRSVGIISHVSELKQRDFNRIEVEKTAFGSSINVKILG